MKYIMSYTSIGREDFCPVGTILAYIGSSTEDPPGWVIANGNERTNGGSDLRYSGLRGLSIGSGSNASYYPPKLDALFLRGIGSQIFSSIEYTGSTYKSGVQHRILEHTHTGTASEHGHTTNPSTSTGNTGSSGSPRYGLGRITSSGQGNRAEAATPNDEPYFPNVQYVAGLIVNNAVPTVTFGTNVLDSNNSALSDASDTETRPFNYGVVWIIKL